MKVNLTNHRGQFKQAPLGFSWTTLLFTMWVAVFRRDWKWAAIMLLANAVLGNYAYSIEKGYLVFIVNIVMAAFYNKLHIRYLLAKGWRPATDFDVQLLQSKGI